MTTQDIALERVHKAIQAIRDGRMVIMVDDEDRENEGDLVFAAEHVCPEKINFMTKYARGLICLSLTPEDVDRLKLPMMADTTKSGTPRETAFTVSIEARSGVSTGISAADRARTVEVAVDPSTGPEDLVVPGHVFPLRARPGGVLERPGHTEGSVDLARMAGMKSSAVICEIMNDDGTMARMSDLEAFAEEHDLPIVTIADLVDYRLQRESLIEELSRTDVQTATGEFNAVFVKSMVDGTKHIALTKGAPFTDKDVVDVRVHRQRPLVDVFAHRGEIPGNRIGYGLELLAKSEKAILVYLTQEDGQEWLDGDFGALAGRTAKADHNRPQSIKMDSRTLGIGAQLLRHMGVRQMRVHMAKPVPLIGLGGFGLDVVETVGIDDSMQKSEG